MTIPRKPMKKGACYHCRKHGHFKRECPELSGEEKKRRDKHKAHKAFEGAYYSSDSDVLIVRHASAARWERQIVGLWIQV